MINMQWIYNQLQIKLIIYYCRHISMWVKSDLLDFINNDLNGTMNSESIVINWYSIYLNKYMLLIKLVISESHSHVLTCNYIVIRVNHCMLNFISMFLSLNIEKQFFLVMSNIMRYVIKLMIYFRLHFSLFLIFIIRNYIVISLSGWNKSQLHCVYTNVFFDFFDSMIHCI